MAPLGRMNQEMNSHNPEVVEKDFTQMVAIGINVSSNLYAPTEVDSGHRIDGKGCTSWSGCHGSSMLPFWNPGKRPEALRIDVGII